jgi:hypothetical protein
MCAMGYFNNYRPCGLSQVARQPCLMAFTAPSSVLSYAVSPLANQNRNERESSARQHEHSDGMPLMFRKSDVIRQLTCFDL